MDLIYTFLTKDNISRSQYNLILSTIDLFHFPLRNISSNKMFLSGKFINYMFPYLTRCSLFIFLTHSYSGIQAITSPGHPSPRKTKCSPCPPTTAVWEENNNCFFRNYNFFYNFFYITFKSIKTLLFQIPIFLSCLLNKFNIVWDYVRGGERWKWRIRLQRWYRVSTRYVHYYLPDESQEVPSRPY